jgi:hypothetical protein
LNNNLNGLQHNTESALILVKNDIMMSADQHKAVVPGLLDFSGTSDTVHHIVLFSQLKVKFACLEMYSSSLNHI